jgi:hypothetical protein
MKAIVEATGFPEINNLLFVWSSISKCVKKFVCSVLYILFAAHSIFCLQRVLYFVCSVLYILFAARSIFCLQCVLYFSAACSIFCLHRVLYFVCSVFYILFAARSIFCLPHFIYMFAANLVQFVTNCYCLWYSQLLLQRNMVQVLLARPTLLLFLQLIEIHESNCGSNRFSRDK